MSLRKLPVIAMESIRADFSHLQFDAPAEALERWSPQGGVAGVRAEKDADGVETISILDIIGHDWFGDGVTSKRVGAALRSIGSNPVRVEINSPGGDMFEGLAIYNKLAAHPAKVTVRVLGLAASAASIIAMAGDEIEMGAGSFLMIHKCWAVAIGNADDMRAAADVLEPFDKSVGGIYAARTGFDETEISRLMTAETWLDAQSAIDQGFADSIVNLPKPAQDKEDSEARGNARAARARTESIFARQGLPRSERRRLIGDLMGVKPERGMPGAAATTMPGAGGIADGAAMQGQAAVFNSMARLLATLKS